MRVRTPSHRLPIGIAAMVIVSCAISAASAREARRGDLLAEMKLPEPVELPRPQGGVVVPDDDHSAPLSIQLEKSPPPGELIVRRASTGDGRLYLGLRAAGGELAGPVQVSRGGWKVAAEIVGGELWLSLVPRFGRMTILVLSPGAAQPMELTTPTTLVEVRGRQILVNGEPFLIKGATSRNLRERDAAYARSLGINTLRGQDALADCERYGFMSIASMGFGDAAPKTAMHASADEFELTLARAMDWLRENSEAAIASPNTLIVQLGNEKSPGSAKPPGTEPLTPTRRNVAHLLAHARNATKSLAPALPVGYSNQDLGFLTPDCMDVYMHNSFLHKDRYGYEWEDLMRWQGCLPPDGPAAEGRPFVNSEFGANRYLCQSYHGGPNNPVLEKIHAWNFPQRWAEFMKHGTAGGAIYCLYDLEQPRDQGCSRFGILTFEGVPKLACWEVGRMWRDFDAEVQAKELVLTYKRDYRASNCRLTIATPDGKSATRTLDHFEPRSSRTIALNDLALEGAAEFRWQMDFSTHGGLSNQASGAWPTRAEEEDFLKRLEPRDTYPFLRELFDAQVMTADGKPAPPTLAEMARPDGIIPVALRKPNGVTYLLLISRENPDKPGPLRDGLSIDVAFGEKVELVDDMTGQPREASIDVVQLPGGLRLRNVQAARIPGAIGQRSAVPFKLPVYRISP